MFKKYKQELEALENRYEEAIDACKKELQNLRRKSTEAEILIQTNKKVQNAFAQEKAFLNWKTDPNCIRAFVDAIDENTSVDVIGIDGSHYVIRKGDKGRQGQRFFSSEEFK